MTREEAIKILCEPGRIVCNVIKANDTDTCEYNAQSLEALQMAIEALSAEPCEDCISIEAVLEAVSKGCLELRGVYGRIETLINNLHSVTPAQSVIEDIKAEREKSSFEYYMEYGEYIGEDCRKEKIVYLDRVLEIIDKHMRGDNT